MLRDRGAIKWTSLMLPEHVELLKTMWKEDKKSPKPILDDQELEMLNQQLIDAYKQQLWITITVYENYSMINHVGIISRIDKHADNIILYQKNGTKINIAFADIMTIRIN